MSARTGDACARGSLVLLTAVDCHLCCRARAVLQVLHDQQAIVWREVAGESDEGRELALTAPPLRPVLFDADGRLLAYGRLSEKRLRRDLASAR